MDRDIIVGIPFTSNKDDIEEVLNKLSEDLDVNDKYGVRFYIDYDRLNNLLGSIELTGTFRVYRK
jgi:hypothetical protein